MICGAAEQKHGSIANVADHYEKLLVANMSASASSRKHQPGTLQRSDFHFGELRYVDDLDQSGKDLPLGLVIFVSLRILVNALGHDRLRRRLTLRDLQPTENLQLGLAALSGARESAGCSVRWA